MKKLTTVTGALLVTGLLAFPMMASARDRGNMMGMDGGKNMEKMCTEGRHRGGDADLTAAQRQQMDALHEKFRADNAETLKSLMDKRFDLQTVLNADKPDLAKAKSLQGEINGLEASLALKHLDLFPEIRKIDPNAKWHQGRK